jgi:hypothetical protein
MGGAHVEGARHEQRELAPVGRAMGPTCGDEQVRELIEVDVVAIAVRDGHREAR